MEYTAGAEERWDLLAYKLLGDAKKVGLLLEVNPLPILEFAGGEKLFIPDTMEDSMEEKPKEVEAPPWL